MYFVYIVRCCDGSLYTGTAADLRRRMREHRTRTAACARYTRSRPVVSLEAAWQTQGRSDALRLEALIKHLARGDKLSLLAAPESVQTVFGEKLAGSVYTPLPPETLRAAFESDPKRADG